MNRFTNDQIREINDAFQMFDKEDRESIGSQDLREMLKVIGYNPTDKVNTMKIATNLYSVILFINFSGARKDYINSVSDNVVIIIY